MPSGGDRYEASREATRLILEALPGEIDKIRNSRIAEKRAVAARRRAIDQERERLIEQIQLGKSRLKELEEISRQTRS